MQKVAYKILGIFLVVLFVMSVTGTAATSNVNKPVANADTFNLSPSHKCAGNVLSNDKGTGLKIATTGYIKTVKGVKVFLKSNGYVCYYPASSFKTGTITDSFTYKIVDKYDRYSSAKVTIYYKCSSKSSTGSSTSCSDNGSSSTGTNKISVVEVTQLSQINTYLKNGPVLVKTGAEWCSYCRKIEPVLASLAKEYEGKATVMSIDIDKSPELASYFEVESIPDTFVIVGIQNGEYVYMKQDGKVSTSRSQARVIGFKDKSVFEKILNSALEYTKE